MHPDRRNELLEKRKQLQVRLRFNEFVQYRIAPFFEILDELQRLQIDFTVLVFRCVPQEFHELLRQYNRTEVPAKYNLTQIPITGEDIEVEIALELYPSANPFRYSFDAPVVGYADSPGEVLRHLMQTHRLAEKKVYLCWLQYAFLIKADLKNLAQKATTDLFNPWYSDAVIFPTDFSWLIAYSDKDEWRLGKLRSNSYHSP